MDDNENIEDTLLKIDAESLGSSAPSTKYAVPPERIFSMEKIALLLKKDRNTIDKWLRNDTCPYVTRGDRTRGIPWQIDIAAVVEWLIEKSVSDAMGKFTPNGKGRMPEGVSKEILLEARAIMESVKTAEAIGRVVPVQYALDRVSKDFNEIKQRLMTLPAAVAGRMDSSIQRSVREIVDEEVRKAIEKLKVEQVVRGARRDAEVVDEE
ncbi:terminase small subunit [Rhizobium sp. L245/93]|uniref:terminase small subunit n=1 Tax=Rhizobium sp. L245/93 TaxID=2819998 RepID=UPI001ADA8604|nr:terminase small subunit [Rhizobium sp. L245/93]MBO9170891.1 terminase small subunit [Rhizobium sp. L245/93]